MRLFVHSVALVMMSVVVFLHPATIVALSGSPRFTEAKCMFDVPAGLSEGSDLQCGYLEVAEQHGVDNGKTIQLAVAIVKSTGANPDSVPLVLLQGGPGGSTIDTYTQLIGYGRLQELRAEYDLVLFDQRGTLYSKPALTCSELWTLTENTIEQRLSRLESNQLSLDATEKCRERLVAEGINLAAYNSLENAADVEDLRVALGYNKINLYGVSYGTLLAQHVMREFPESLRAVVLDAVVPTDINFVTEIPQTQSRAYRELFEACAADTTCDAAYPDLEQVFFDTVAKLNEEPARVLLTDPETKKTYQAVMDGDAFESTLFQLLYATEVLPALPATIYDVQAGNYAFLSRIMPLFVFDRTIAVGMYNSVLCAEDADFRAGDVDVSGVRPELADTAEQDAAAFLDSCRIWGVPEVDAPLDEPVTASIPTLVLNGRFDPITPPANGEHVAASLSKATNVVFGYSGHGALGSGSCPNTIVRDFLRDPLAPPDLSCVALQPAPAFLTPSSIAFTHLPGRILDAFEGKNVVPVVLAVICLVPLLTLFLVWPIAWLVRMFSKVAPSRRSGILALARWVAVIAAIVGLTFALGLTVVVFQAASSGNDIVLLFGIPAGWRWLLFLPWLMALCVVLMIAATVVGWKRRSWPAWEGVYYSLLTVAAAVTAAGMILLIA